MKKINMLATLILAASALGMVSCGGGKPAAGGNEKTGTAAIVEKASKMNLQELEAAAEKEMKESNDTFKVVGLTSTLVKALDSMASKYDWLVSEKEQKAAEEAGDTTVKANVYCKNDYKDYSLLTALDAAENSYFADFALVQDARNLADYLEDGITHNFVPSDYKDLGLAEKDTYPLKGIHFNKIFYTNKDFATTTGIALTNVWQLAKANGDSDAKHIAKYSFQSPQTEQINMSFLLSCMAEENQPRIKEAYKDYYGTDWQAGGSYKNAGEQLVYEMIENVTTWHGSDGTAMKETQVTTKDTVFYGAFAKMKDAAGKNYDLDGDGEKETNAMTTVDWNLPIKGFSGFMYTMYSQIVNNAKHPYTACLYARHLLTPDCYKAMCYNATTPNKAGDPANMYGYYYPCTSTTTGINDNDITKEQWIERSIVEDYNYLKDVKMAQVQAILTKVTAK